MKGVVKSRSISHFVLRVLQDYGFAILTDFPADLTFQSWFSEIREFLVFRRLLGFRCYFLQQQGNKMNGNVFLVFNFVCICNRRSTKWKEKSKERKETSSRESRIDMWRILYCPSVPFVWVTADTQPLPCPLPRSPRIYLWNDFNDDDEDLRDRLDDEKEYTGSRKTVM